MRYLLYLFTIALGIQSCDQRLPLAIHKTNYSLIPNLATKEIYVNQINMDSIIIKTADDESLSSMIGHFFFKSDTLCFADQQLASILCYNLQGQYITSHLDRGRGKNEILGLREINNTNPNQISILDPNWTIYIFNNNWEKIEQFRILWGKPQSYKKLLKHYTADELGIYELEYNGIFPWRKDYLILPITTEHRYYNAYFGKNIDHFYENSYCVGIVDRKKGMLTKMICTRPPVYQNYKYIPNFSQIIMDVKQDTLFYSFRADSSIYMMNLNDSSLCAYGNQGIAMNTAYRETNTLEEAENNFNTDLENYGYYYHLKIIPETNILFRSYRKDAYPQKDGLQIYNKNILIGDCPVPRNFKVFGYHNSYYYATGEPNLENDQMVVYKFKLK